MKPGDIILLCCPFTDLSELKVRPALVISSVGYNQRQDDVIVLPITRNIERTSQEDVVVDPGADGCQRTGLRAISAIRAGKIFTVEKDLAKRLLGTVPQELLANVRSSLKELLLTS